MICGVSPNELIPIPDLKEGKMFVIEKIDGVNKLTVHGATEPLNSNREQQKPVSM